MFLVKRFILNLIIHLISAEIHCQQSSFLRNMFLITIYYRSLFINKMQNIDGFYAVSHRICSLVGKDDFRQTVC